MKILGKLELCGSGVVQCETLSHQAVKSRVCTRALPNLRDACHTLAFDVKEHFARRLYCGKCIVILCLMQSYQGLRSIAANILIENDTILTRQFNRYVLWSLLKLVVARCICEYDQVVQEMRAHSSGHCVYNKTREAYLLPRISFLLSASCLQRLNMSNIDTSVRMMKGPCFRDLPLELRIQVYQYLFAQSEIVYVNKDWSEPIALIAALSSHLGVEAEEIQREYYRGNQFGYLLTNLKTEEGVYDYQGLITVGDFEIIVS